MVYEQKFVMCVLVNNKVQNELADKTVALPDNCEYTLRFRNKNNRRAVVKFTIDGEDASGPGGYAIDAGDYIDIERHSIKSRKFKFVSTKSEDAVDFGKNGPNHDRAMGVIEARFYFEKEHPTPPIVIEKHIHHHHEDHWWPRRRVYPYVQPMPFWGQTTLTSGDCDAGPQIGSQLRSNSLSGGMTSLSCAAENTPVSYAAPSPPVLQDGCTVEGSVSNQTFGTTYIETETSCVTLMVVLRLDTSLEPMPSKKPVRTKLRGKVGPGSRRKNPVLDDLESENEELRRKIAEKENNALKKKLEDLESSNK